MMKSILEIRDSFVETEENQKLDSLSNKDFIFKNMEWEIKNIEWQNRDKEWKIENIDWEGWSRSRHGD